MKMNNLVKKLAICGSTLLMVASVTPGMSNVSAHCTHRTHTYRKYSKHYSLAYLISYFNRVSRYNEKHDDQFDTAYYRHLVNYTDKHFLKGERYVHMSRKQRRALSHAQRDATYMLENYSDVKFPRYSYKQIMRKMHEEYLGGSDYLAHSLQWNLTHNLKQYTHYQLGQIIKTQEFGNLSSRAQSATKYAFGGLAYAIRIARAKHLHHLENLADDYENDTGRTANREAKELLNGLKGLDRKQAVQLDTYIDENLLPDNVVSKADKFTTKNYGLGTPDKPSYNNQGSAWLNEVRAESIRDINKARVANGERPLTISGALQQDADYRAPKVQYAYDHYNDYLNYPHDTSNPSDNWIHGEDTHTSGDEYLDKHEYKYSGWGANAANYFYDSISYDPGIGFQAPVTNPDKIADSMNNDYLNNDMNEGNNDGHRYNMLDKNWKYLGVGVSYNPKTQTGSENEQYGY